MAVNLDWKNLSFEYRQTNMYAYANFTKGQWSPIATSDDPYIRIHIGASSLHYGQACFEGLKAFTRRDGSIAIFRPEANAKRLNMSAQRIVMEPIPSKLFIDACVAAIEGNKEFVPPYGTGASLYLRPLLIGTTPRIGLNASDDYTFLVLVTPVGPYYKDGFFPVKARIHEEYDRAAPKGVGNVKVAGNYAAGLKGDLEAKKAGFSVGLYLDAAEHSYIDEFGTSNFIGITADGHYVTPSSNSILPSITNDSLQVLAHDLGLVVERRKIHISELPLFSEVGACGTAAVITPVCSIAHGSQEYRFGSESEAMPTLTKLYKMFQGIQYGELSDTHTWMYPVE